ncbi:MAG TPA: hypothetical protein DCM62_09460 [Bacteroidales bacterium]|nr:hypothetical protein [Bacteroidales bacterium]
MFSRQIYFAKLDKFLRYVCAQRAEFAIPPKIDLQITPERCFSSFSMTKAEPMESSRPKGRVCFYNSIEMLQFDTMAALSESFVQCRHFV